MCLRLLFLTFLLSPAFVASAADVKQEATGFVVQDVCEVAGRVTAESPLTCPGRVRDLGLGERLPYHKHDWPNRQNEATLANGQMRGDSFPIRWGSADAAIHTFDHAHGPRAFGRYDEGDGGDLYLITDRGASIALTQTSKGRYYYVGPGCAGSDVPSRLADSWILFQGLPQSGEAIASLRLATEPQCPRRLDRSWTVWRTRAIRFRANLEGELTSPVSSLVVDHFSRETAEQSASMERHYLTRELGVTRWEKWQNFAHPATSGTAGERRDRLAASGRCDEREPGPAANWHMLDCREFTNLVPATDPMGDPPDFWLDTVLPLAEEGGHSLR